jgi:hypothetical protein
MADPSAEAPAPVRALLGYLLAVRTEAGERESRRNYRRVLGLLRARRREDGA